MAITCELCGSNDVIKQGDFFVCQSCGTKYSLEEAKKLLGTVNPDNSNDIQKYLQSARRAKEKEDWGEVEKYYDLVEQNEPSNIEAIFYRPYAKAKLSMVDGDVYKRQQICDVFCNCISLIDDNYDLSKKEENQQKIIQMHIDLFNMYGSRFVYTETRSDYGSSDNRYETYFMFAKMAMSFIGSVENIIRIDDQLIYWKIIYEQYRYLAGNEGLKVEARNKYRELAISTGNKIHEKDPSFVVDQIEEAKESSGGGCYVATAVYGSYDCPEVWTLRRYRDYTLAGTWYGRAFVRTYYAISPTLVKWFGETEWFRNLWRPKLDRMVEDLNKKGIADSPYQDRNW